MNLLWYVRRLSRMGPKEVAGRVATTVRIRRWRRFVDAPGPAWSGDRRFLAVLPDGALQTVPAPAKRRLLDTAEELMKGRAKFFGVTREDMVDPDWSCDPRTGRRAPTDAYSFNIAYRDEQAVGDIKQLWEPSRHQHLTLLGAAYALTRDERYAARIADHLKFWWAENPPMRGVHWVSGIELGIRLLSWVWVRRLLDGWAGAPALFEQNPEAVRQIYHHQRWLAAFASHGSSANNHAIAEWAGQLAAASAFDWFPESPRWRTDALRSLDKHLRDNTFESGLNRELATEYHGLVLELGLAAVIEADAAGLEVPESTWLVLLRMTDALAAVLDSYARPPRQGDADDGRGLVLDGDGTNRWASLLATGDVLFQRLGWWPKFEQTDVRTGLLTSLIGPRSVVASRPADRPAHFADAGLTVLRSAEIWCRCDGGPHGFLAIAAHAHADALSLEVRHGQVDILADPGCYCYHGEPDWRTYFRSTVGHNTLEIDGVNQSRSGGAFLWTRHAVSRVLVVRSEPEGVSRWRADHDGYGTRRRPVVHVRSVELDAPNNELRISDELVSTRSHECRLAFHLGPSIEVDLDGDQAGLRWTNGAGGAMAGLLDLPDELSWTLHRGEANPPLGWYSAGFGRKEPAVTLIGRGRLEPAAGRPLETRLKFLTEHESR